ncbi:MAG TPA: PspA/IM30 family protein [Polyangia bacterium]|jgi:phage shock protein A
MGILGRLSSLVKSNVNDVIDRMQDPAKEIDQMVRDMEESARQARTEVAQCLAAEKQLQKRVADLDGEGAEWGKRAELAVRAGDDALAKEALRRKAEKEAERVEAQKAVQEQGVYADQLTQALKALDARLADVKLRQGSLRAKARANKKGSPLSGKTSAFDDFDRMAGKIDAVEAEAGLDEQLAGRTAESAAAERKLNELAAQSTVDDALAELKKKLGGGS